MEAAHEAEQTSNVGWLYNLPPHEQEALVEAARLTVDEMRGVDRADHKELDDYHRSRRKTNIENELDALFYSYALALSFFDRWQRRGVQTLGEANAALAKFGGEEGTQVRYGAALM